MAAYLRRRVRCRREVPLQLCGHQRGAGEYRGVVRFTIRLPLNSQVRGNITQGNSIQLKTDSRKIYGYGEALYLRGWRPCVPGPCRGCCCSWPTRACRLQVAEPKCRCLRYAQSLRDGWHSPTTPFSSVIVSESRCRPLSFRMCLDACLMLHLCHWLVSLCIPESAGLWLPWACSWWGGDMKPAAGAGERPAGRAGGGNMCGWNCDCIMCLVKRHEGGRGG